MKEKDSQASGSKNSLGRLPFIKHPLCTTLQDL